MIALEPLANCGPRELVKVKVESGTEWAMVGARVPGMFPLIILTGEDGPPFVLNIDWADPGDFEMVAKFGSKYRLVPDPNGPCQIGDGTLSKSAGSLILTDKGDWYLVVNNRQAPGLRWIELKGGTVLGEPGSRRIAFGKWDLLVEGLEQNPSETTLLSFPPNPTK